MKKGAAIFLAVILISAPLAAQAASIPIHKSLLFSDDYEGAYPQPDITDDFRSLTTGLSAAWYDGCESATAKLVDRMDGMAAEVSVPQGCHLDYVGYLNQPVGNKVFLLTWDIEIQVFPVVINGAKNGRRKVYHFGDSVAERREYGVIFYLSISEVAH